MNTHQSIHKKRNIVDNKYTNITLRLVCALTQSMKIRLPRHILDHVCDYAPLHRTQLQKCLIRLPRFLKSTCYYRGVFSYDVHTFSKTEFEIVAINQDDQVRRRDCMSLCHFCLQEHCSTFIYESLYPYSYVIDMINNAIREIQVQVQEQILQQRNKLVNTKLSLVLVFDRTNWISSYRACIINN